MWIKLAFLLARILAVTLLLLALMDNPTGYYHLLRLAISAICVFGVYCANRWRQFGWLFVFAWLAILFNPIYQVSLPVWVWHSLDVATAATIVASLFLLKPRRLSAAA